MINIKIVNSSTKVVLLFESIALFWRFLFFAIRFLWFDVHFSRFFCTFDEQETGKFKQRVKFFLK